MLGHPHSNSTAPIFALVGILPRAVPRSRQLYGEKGELTVIPAVIGPSSAGRRAPGRGRDGLRGLHGTGRRQTDCNGCQRV